ncbi:ribonuclease catalytic domain-containing protein [Fundidesulfovibrio butyratiphilus]
MSKHPSLVTSVQPGCVVEFLQGNEAHLAWVEDVLGDKLRLFTLNKRESKLAASRLLPWSGPRYEGAFNREGVLEKLREHAKRREELLGQADPLELWEMAQGEVAQASAGWFAQLAHEDPDADRVAAMGRALLGLKTHFRFQPPNFEVHPADVVERRLAEQAVARERELVVTAGQSFFHDLWTGWASGREVDARRLEAQLDPQAAEKLKDMLLGLLCEPESQHWAPLWQALRKGLPDHPHQPLILATQWGVIPPHFNIHLSQAQYHEGDAWSADFAGEIHTLSETCRQDAAPAQGPPYVSVDSSTTRDIDDAFHVSVLPDGGYALSMALARPCLHWDFDSPLGRAVWDRATSLYLPEGSSHMLPEALSCELYSLRAGCDKPALLLDWELSPRGRTRSFTLRAGWARVAANLCYEEVERRLADKTADANLSLALALAERLRDRRVEAGAVVLDRPEPKIVLHGYPHEVSVTLAPGEHTPMAQLMVSEFMILANAEVAALARREGLPLYYRVQDVAIPPNLAGVWTDPVDMHRAVKQLSGAILSNRPGRHASLGADQYSPVTSPLRRLPDFVNMAQVQSWLATGRPRFSAEEVAAKLPGLSARLDQVGLVQRYRPRYWKLACIQGQCRQREFSAVVVEENSGYVTLSLIEAQIYVRAGREQLGGKVYLGQKFLVKLGKVDPLTNELRVMGGREDDCEGDGGPWPDLPSGETG